MKLYKGNFHNCDFSYNLDMELEQQFIAIILSSFDAL